MADGKTHEWRAEHREMEGRTQRQRAEPKEANGRTQEKGGQNIEWRMAKHRETEGRTQGSGCQYTEKIGQNTAGGVIGKVQKIEAEHRDGGLSRGRRLAIHRGEGGRSQRRTKRSEVEKGGVAFFASCCPTT